MGRWHELLTQRSGALASRESAIARLVAAHPSAVDVDVGLSLPPSWALLLRGDIPAEVTYHEDLAFISDDSADGMISSTSEQPVSTYLPGGRARSPIVIRPATAVSHQQKLQLLLGDDGQIMNWPTRFR